MLPSTAVMAGNGEAPAVPARKKPLAVAAIA